MFGHFKFYVVLLCWLGYLPVSAQYFYNAAEQVIFIDTLTTLTIHGNAANTGTIINKGTLAVAGNWENKGIYNASKGKLMLNGAETQRINNNGQDVYVLILEGGGEKLLANDLTVTDSLILINGNLTPDQYLFHLEGETEIRGDPGSSFINGQLVRQGTGYKFFPIGKNGNYRPITLLDVTGIDPLIGIEVIENAPVADQIHEDLSAVSEIRYWQTTVLSGKYDSSLVELSVGDDEGFEDLDGAVVAEALEADNIFRTLGQSAKSGDPTNGTVVSEKQSKGGILALGLTALFALKNEILVPSAFSPRAIHPDDQQLRIYGNEVDSQDFSFRIFNRWNKIVYETNSFQEASTQGWDGMNHKTGEPAQFGIYNYLLRYKFTGGPTKQKTGTITLIR